MSNQFKNHIEELGGNDVSYFKNTFNDRHFANSVKSGDLVEILYQIGARLTTIENNIDYIKNFMFQSTNQQGAPLRSGEHAEHNPFVPPGIAQGQVQVVTPNFKMQQKIDFGPKIPEKQDSQIQESKPDVQKQEAESKEISKPLISPKSFDSFQEKEVIKDSQNVAESVSNKLQMDENLTPDLSEKEKTNSPEATGSDVIVSGQLIKSGSEEVYQNQEKKKENEKYGNKKKGGYYQKNQKKRYRGGYNRYKKRYYDDDHYHF